MTFLSERRGALWYNERGEQAGIIVLGGMFAAPLRLGHQERHDLTCTTAGFDYYDLIPDYARYVIVSCASDVIVAFDEPTSPTVGVNVPAGVDSTFPLMADPLGDGCMHVQSPDAGAVVTFVYLGE